MCRSSLGFYNIIGLSNLPATLAGDSRLLSCHSNNELEAFLVPFPISVQHLHPSHQWLSSIKLIAHSAVKSLQSRFSLSGPVGLSLGCFFSLFVTVGMCRYVQVKK